jgi:hypothetical protein
MRPQLSIFTSSIITHLQIDQQVIGVMPARNAL